MTDDADDRPTGGEPLRDALALQYTLGVLRDDPLGQSEAWARTALRGHVFTADVLRRSVRMVIEALPYRGCVTRRDAAAALQSRLDYLVVVFGALLRLDADAQDAAVGDNDPDCDYLDGPLRRLTDQDED